MRLFKTSHNFQKGDLWGENNFLQDETLFILENSFFEKFNEYEHVMETLR